MKTKDIYAHKPAELTSLKDLLAFFAGIPNTAWCVDTVEDNMGRCCAIGHLSQAYLGDATDSPEPLLRRFNHSDASGDFSQRLIVANNGRSMFEKRPKSVRTSGLAIKRRVLKFLHLEADKN